MIRIWNMNCSRISRNQGIRTLIIQEIYKKNVLFAGDIKQASGNLNDSVDNFESIIFTTDKQVLMGIAQQDWYLKLLKDEKQKNFNFIKKL